ncbi:MAG: UDP-3-O-[3-hydroxymyristoyl] N-acetylglucosamine deacetylase [SAR324 cluster bacterium]|nr:UDP-3-O-[3-hydroxymyristoyl] N-acetylglucosamine deacetylase [SAR324 cluster bacterium]
MEPIYVVDDEPAICETLGGVLQDEGYSVVSCPDAQTLFKRIPKQKPSLVLLDIWLPGADGMEVLQEFKGEYPDIPVIMISGHAGIESAVSSIKLGAYDFLEKPLHLDVLLDKVSGALADKPKRNNKELPSDTRLEVAICRKSIHADSISLVESEQPQRTLKKNIVLNGTGLLSGRNTGIIMSPLGVNEGIIFQSLDGYAIPGNITSLENFSQTDINQTFTANSTVLASNNRRVRTIEHLMAVLHMFGITNAQIKTDEEIPNVDGSAKNFCQLIHDAGIVEQSENAQKVVFHEKVGVGPENLNDKHLYIEPFQGFKIKMRVDYPAPIFEQCYTFNPKEQSFEDEIAAARSFNTFENIDMAQKMGKVGSGYLHSHIIMHDGKVINTELRYPDEFVRHKILDLIGDLYMLGCFIEGSITANMTSHGYNQALVKRIHTILTETSSLH